MVCVEIIDFNGEMMVTVFCRSGVVESRQSFQEFLNANVVNLLEILSGIWLNMPLLTKAINTN